jgi:hypothetical protein
MPNLGLYLYMVRQKKEYTFKTKIPRGSPRQKFEQKGGPSEIFARSVPEFFLISSEFKKTVCLPLNLDSQHYQTGNFQKKYENIRKIFKKCNF